MKGAEQKDCEEKHFVCVDIQTDILFNGGSKLLKFKNLKFLFRIFGA